jgi:hypothetical protein
MCRQIAGLVLLGLVLGWSLPASAGYVADMQQTMQTCREEHSIATDQHNCLLKATPQKCKPYVAGKYGMFYSSQVQQLWRNCLESCDDATFRSRHFGECSRFAAARTR